MGDKPEYFRWFSKKSLKVKRKLFENEDRGETGSWKREEFWVKVEKVGFKGFNSSCLCFESYCLEEEHGG
jgi:hypothetical protein